MGWLFCKPTKEDLVNHLLDPAQYGCGKIVDHSLRGSRLWALFERDNGERFVLLFLLSKASRNGYSYQWGYKDMDEQMHPYYYDCPLRILNAATPNERAESWREAVRRHHAKKATKPTSGMTVRYGSEEYRLNHSLGRRGWDVTRTRDGVGFRMKAQQVSKAMNQAEAA